MRAILQDGYGSPDLLRVADVDRPAPAGDQVLVEVVAASLNTADLDHLVGSPLLLRLWTGLRRPRIPRVGLDVAGRVVGVGPEVTELRPGDEVWGDLFELGRGAFAEHVSAPERAFSPKPPGVSFEEAATGPHSGLLALQALDSRAPIQAGEEVLVNGAGGCVGPFAIQIAKARGAVVTAVDHPDKFDLMEEAGADRLVDYTREDVTRHRRRYDLVVDIAATRSPLRFRRCLTPGGRYVLIARGLGGFFQAAVLGGRSVGVFRWMPNRRRDLETLGRMMEAGEVRPVVDRRYRLEEAPEAFRRQADGTARGKLVIVPDRARPNGGERR